MMFRQHSTSWFILLLAAISVIVFWSLYNGQFTLRGEAADMLIPIFSHIRESLYQGDWPLWNKYQQQGFAVSILPIYWNPMVLILGYLFSSPHLALNAVYLILSLIGGLGFYKLTLLFLADNRLAFIGGLCYPLVGFFVVQSQYMDLISTAAWTPLLAYLTWQYTDQGKVRYLSFLAIGYFLFTTSTSFGFVLIISTIMVAGLLYRHYSHGSSIFRSMVVLATFFAAGFLVWKIYWIRWQSYIPITDTDLKGGTLYDNIQDLVSLFLSTSTLAGGPSLNGFESLHFHSYVGTLILLFAVASIGFSRTKTDLRLLVSSIIFLLFSFAGTLVETRHVVMSGMYEMPFTGSMKILLSGSLLILGLRGIGKVAVLTNKSRIYIVITAMVLLGLIYFLKELIKSDNNQEVVSWLLKIDFLKSVIFIACTTSLLWIRRPQLRFYLIAGLVVMEIGLSNYLNQDSSLFSEYPTSAFSSLISYPEKITPFVDLNSPIGFYGDQDFKMASLKRNTGTLTKRIVKDGYTPWETKTRNDQKSSEDWKRQLRYPLFYFSQDTSILAKPSYTNFDDPIIIHSQTDHHWDLSLVTRYEKHLVFNQNFDRNWQAYVDGELMPVTKTGTGMMKIPITPGLHTVSLLYRTDGLLHIFGATMATLTILIILLIIKGNFPFTFLIVLFPVIVLFLSKPGYQSPEKRGLISQKPQQDTTIFKFDYEDHSPFWFFRSWQITPENSFSGYRSESLNQKAEYSATLQIHQQALKNKNELLFEFQCYSEEPIDAGVVLKTYTEGDDSYNIKYFTSLNTGQWKTIKGGFSLQKLKGPLVKADIYIWNYQKHDFLIDDIKINLIP